jgi:GAF domain-containing protein
LHVITHLAAAHTRRATVLHDASVAYTRRTMDDIVANACAEASSLTEAGASQREVLTCLVAAAERLAPPGAVASILVIDEDGLLRNGASPNLPRDYLQAIDRLKPDASVGTCAAAAATGMPIVTCDFRADDKWAELRHLPLALGFMGAWSMPIKAENGQILGTLGTYFREVRTPTETEIAAVRRLATCAARALGHHLD